MYLRDQKWLKGTFEKGRIVKVAAEASAEIYDSHSWLKELKTIHQAAGTRWIDLLVAIESEITLFSRLNQIVVANPQIYQAKSKE